MSAARPTPKPWSMKWIVLAIAVFVVGYTVVNIYFRKPNKPYRPYQDAQDRATTVRLLAAGWQKVPLETRRPLEKPENAAPAAISRELAGLGPDLEGKFAEKPKLFDTIDRVAAPAAVRHGADYSFHFTASLTDLKLQLGELALFRHGNELVLIPAEETLPGKGLMSRWNDSTYAVTFSTANFAPGRYTVRIVARGPAAAWSFTVQ